MDFRFGPIGGPMPGSPCGKTPNRPRPSGRQTRCSKTYSAMPRPCMGGKRGPLRGHGTWNGQQPFVFPEAGRRAAGAVAVLTRASIARKQALRFWWNVPGASRGVQDQPGLRYAKGVGRVSLGGTGHMKCVEFGGGTRRICLPKPSTCSHGSENAKAPMVFRGDVHPHGGIEFHGRTP